MTCNKCQGRGLIIKDNIAYPCSCLKENSRKKIWLSSGLPPALVQNKFKNFDFQYYSATKKNGFSQNNTYLQIAKIVLNEAKNFVKKILVNPSKAGGLLISGQVGSGKTFLASCIANALLDKDCQVLFMVVPDLLDRLKSTYDNLTVDSEQSVLDEARTAPVLILDDLGAHNYTEWTRNKLYSIINYRLNYQLPTTITTNISVEDLTEFLGERTTSRIVQMCTLCRLVVEEDIRLLKRYKTQDNKYSLD